MKNEFNALKLENQLCFPLYAAAREVIKKYRPFLDELGLTYTQYLTLMVLWEQREISVKALGKRLFLDSGTLTPVLKSLEKKKLITRSRLAKDERVTVAALTKEGETLKQRAVCVPSRIAECMPLDPQEAGSLYRLLYKLLQNSR